MVVNEHWYCTGPEYKNSRAMLSQFLHLPPNIKRVFTQITSFRRAKQQEIVVDGIPTYCAGNSSEPQGRKRARHRRNPNPISLRIS